MIIFPPWWHFFLRASRLCAQVARAKHVCPDSSRQEQLERFWIWTVATCGKKNIRQIDTSNKPIIIMINALMHWRLWLCKFHEASPAKKDPSSIGVFWRPYFDLVVYTPPKLQSHGRFHLFTSASPTPTSSMKYTKGPAALFFALGLSIRGSPK